MVLYLKVATILLVIPITLSARSSQQNQTVRKERSLEYGEPYFKHFYKHKLMVNDMPNKGDLKTYVKSIYKIIKFSTEIKYDISVNLALGLFLMKVNLQTALRYKSRGLPQYVLEPLREILKKNDELLKLFYFKLMQENSAESIPYKHIFRMFTNDEEWSDRLEKYNAILDKISKQSSDRMDVGFDKWDEYMNRIRDSSDCVPSYAQSDMCLASLAENPSSNYERIPACALNDTCYDVLSHGTNHGYALTHRILVMLLARLSRGCTVFSPAIDRERLLRFCSMAYSESKLIASNNFQLHDLLMEQIALCTLDGHSEFLMRSWLSELLRYQAPTGSFTGKKVSQLQARQPWTTTENAYQQDISAQQQHLTATAAGTFSAAIRYILDTYSF